MNEHQHDRYYSCQAVDIGPDPSGHFEHEPGPCGVKDQPGPEKNKVPRFQPAGEPFAPYADGIKDQRQAYENCRNE